MRDYDDNDQTQKTFCVCDVRQQWRAAAQPVDSLPQKQTVKLDNSCLLPRNTPYYAPWCKESWVYVLAHLEILYKYKQKFVIQPNQSLLGQVSPQPILHLWLFTPVCNEAWFSNTQDFPPTILGEIGSVGRPQERALNSSIGYPQHAFVSSRSLSRPITWKDRKFSTELGLVSLIVHPGWMILMILDDAVISD